MMKLLRTCRAAVMALPMALGLLTSAQAALYQGTWDPAFGYPYPDLGWRGSFTVYVPTACDQGDTTGTVYVSNFAGNPAPNCNGNAQLTSAVVTLYQLSAPTHVQTLDFTGLMNIYSLQFDNGELSGLGAYSVQSVSAGGFAPAIRGGESAADHFFLNFNTTEFSSEAGPSLAGEPAGCGGDCPVYLNNPTGDPALVPTLVVRRLPGTVPEPGSLALMGLALGAAAWASRRRR